MATVQSPAEQRVVLHNVTWDTYERLLADIARHRTTLIFADSRYKAERRVLRLRELAGNQCEIGVHHGSMSRESHRHQCCSLLEPRVLDAACA